MRRTRAATHDQGIRRVRAAAGRQHAQDHRAHQERRLLALLVLHAGDVALRDVAEFMAHDRGELVSVGDGSDQPQVHPHVTTGERERVHAFVTHQQQVPRESVCQLGRHLAELTGRVTQRPPNALQVIDQHGVVQVVGVRHQLAHDGLAQTALLRHAHAVAVADVGQAGCIRLGLYPPTLNRARQGQAKGDGAQTGKGCHGCKRAGPYDGGTMLTGGTFAIHASLFHP